MDGLLAQAGCEVTAKDGGDGTLYTERIRALNP
jgi:hypothetical protein